MNGCESHWIRLNPPNVKCSVEQFQSDMGGVQAKHKKRSRSREERKRGGTRRRKECLEEARMEGKTRRERFRETLYLSNYVPVNSPCLRLLPWSQMTPLNPPYCPLLGLKAMHITRIPVVDGPDQLWVVLKLTNIPLYYLLGFKVTIIVSSNRGSRASGPYM